MQFIHYILNQGLLNYQIVNSCAASLGFRKIRLKRSVNGRYHITKAEILLYFTSLPNGVSSGGWDSCTIFFVPFLFLFFPWMVRPHRKGHCSCTDWPHTGDIYLVPRNCLWWSPKCRRSTGEQLLYMLSWWCVLVRPCCIPCISSIGEFIFSTRGFVLGSLAGT